MLAGSPCPKHGERSSTHRSDVIVRRSGVVVHLIIVLVAAVIPAPSATVVTVVFVSAFGCPVDQSRDVDFLVRSVGQRGVAKRASVENPADSKRPKRQTTSRRRLVAAMSPRGNLERYATAPDVFF